MSAKLDFLNYGKNLNEEFCFIYKEDNVKDKSWFEVIHMKFRDFLAYLTYDKNQRWIDFIISSLSDIEMIFHRMKSGGLRRAINKTNDIILNSNLTLEGLDEFIPNDMLYCQGCIFRDTSKIAKFFYGEQMCGYCHYLKKGDFSFKEPTDLLWDGCKECGLNDEEYELE